MRRFLALVGLFLLHLTVGVRAEVAHQVHLVQQIEVDGEIVEIIDLMPYTGDGFTTSNAVARAGYIFTHWSTSVVQDFANRDPWGRAYEQASFSLYETMTNTAHYVREDLDSDADGVPDGLELYWYGSLDVTAASDTDGDGFGFVQELGQGTNPHFADSYPRGILTASAKPQFFKVILRSEPEGTLFDTITNNVAPDVWVTTESYDPSTSSFAYWVATGTQVAARDDFGRAFNGLSFAMPSNDVELVAICKEDEASRQSLYWYGNETTELTSDTDGDGLTLADEVRYGTSPLFADTYSRGVMCVSAKPQFFKLILRSEPENELFATITNNIAPGVAVSTLSYNPTSSTFAHWEASDAAIITRDDFGRALDSLTFTMPTEDVELVAVCKEEAEARQSLYWYGNETTELTSDTDGDGLTLAEEVYYGTNPLFSDTYLRGVMGASAKPQFFKLIQRCEPENELFAAITNNIAPGVAVTTTAYSPSSSTFAHWESSDAVIATRDDFGRALDALAFSMPTNDIVLVAVCKEDAGARQSLYWYGNETTALTSDTDGDGLTFAEEIYAGTSPLFVDAFNRGVMGASAKPQFFRLILQCDPIGTLFASVTNNVAPGVGVATDAYSPSTSKFAYWSSSDTTIITRDAFGRALDGLDFAMPSKDVELTAVCQEDDITRQSLYWYGNETTTAESDTDGDGLSFAQEIHYGTNPLFADFYSRGVSYALSEELEADLQPFEQIRGAIVEGEYEELFTSTLAGNEATSKTFGGNVYPLAADVDGDGLFDLVVVSKGKVQVFLNKGSLASPDFLPLTLGAAWANFEQLLQGMVRPLICAANGVYYVSDNGGAIYAFTLADGTLVDTGLMGIPGILDGRLFALTSDGTIAAEGWRITLDTPVIEGVAVSTADIDADGRTDLLVSDSVGHIWLYRNVSTTTEIENKSLSFKLLHKVWAGTGVGFATGMTISLVDWDDDGDQDVLIGTPEGKIMLLRDPRTGRPTNVKASPGVDNVLLTWDPNNQPRIRGYNVYRAPEPDGFSRIANQIPLPTYRDKPSVLRDYYYRITSLSRFYIAGNSTPTVYESMPTDAIYVQFRPSVWLNNTSGFTESNVTVIVSMNNSMGISAEGLSMTFTYDPEVLEPRGIRTTGLTEALVSSVSVGSGTETFTSQGGEIATGAGRFLLLDFKIKSVHDITSTTISLTEASLKALDGRSISLDLPQTATIEISDSNPIVPAIVAVGVDNASVESETDFELPVTITTTEKLTNFAATVTWDTDLLELKGLVGAGTLTIADGTAALTTSGDDFALKFYAKDPESATTDFSAKVNLKEIAALDCHGFEVQPDDATGIVLIRNAHPWVSARVSISTESQRVDTLEEVAVPFKMTTDTALVQGKYKIEWNSAVLELKSVVGGRLSESAQMEGWALVENEGSDFALTFLALDQHTVTMSQINLTEATVKDAHGFTVAPSVPVTATLLIHDAHPLIPAQVAMTLGDVQTSTETDFEMELSISTTETLTSLKMTLDYDTSLLELKEGELEYEGNVPSKVVLRFYAKENHTVNSTVVTITPVSGMDKNGLQAVLPEKVEGTVVLADSNPWVPATVSVGMESVKVDTLKEFEVPVAITSNEILTNFVATVEWDDAVLEYRGENPIHFKENVPSTFTLPFYAKDQHDITRTNVRLVEMSAVDEHGLTANTIANALGAVLISDSKPLVPAGVVLNVSEVYTDTLSEFTVQIPVTSTKVLTNLTFTLGWDSNLLEFRSAAGGATVVGEPSENAATINVKGTVPSVLYLTFYAKDQHTATKTTMTISKASAYCVDGLAAKMTLVDGTVYLTDANVPEPVELLVKLGNAKAQSGQTFPVIIAARTSGGDLASMTLEVEWDASLLTFNDAPSAQTVETLASNKRKFVFACSGNYNQFSLNFTASTITALQVKSWLKLHAASGVGKNGLDAVLNSELVLPRTETILIVREVGKYDPGDVDGDGAYTNNDLLILNGYITYKNLSKRNGVIANGFANGYMSQYGVEVRLTGDAARAADVNCDGVVDLNDLTFLQDMIKEAEGAGQ